MLTPQASAVTLPCLQLAVWNGRKPLFKDKKVEALSCANRDEIIIRCIEAWAPHHRPLPA